jgi:hypothetical protein
VPLTVQDKALKEVQSVLQVQKEWNKMFRSFVDGEANKVDVHRVLQQLKQMQRQFNDHDIDQVVD